MSAHGLMFHHFHDNNIHVRGQGSLDLETFEKIIKSFNPEGYLSPAEWVKAVEERALKPHHWCITFDDALRCQYDVALPVLDKLGFKAFWFIYTSIYEGHQERLEIYRHFINKTFPHINDFYEAFFRKVDLDSRLKDVDIANYLSAHPFYSYNDRKYRFIRNNLLSTDQYNLVMEAFLQKYGYDIAENLPLLWMSRDQIRLLAEQDHMIGVHSHTHPYELKNLPASEQRAEYVKNFTMLTEIIQQKPICGAHPCDSFNQDTLVILKDLGIRIMFRSNMSNADHYTQFELPREDHSNILRNLKS